jgi:tetratricopeptide (TPR) repeat protein
MLRGHSLRALWVLAVVAAVTTARSSACAQADAGVADAAPADAGVAPDAAPAETVGHQEADTAARARDEFMAGIAHFQAERYSDAIHSFQVAASLVPSADIWYNIARSYEELARSRGEANDYEQAIEFYRRYLTARVDPPDRATVEQNIANLTERLEAARQAAQVAPTTGTLRLRSEREGATVHIDDRDLGRTPIADDVTLSPGNHRVRAELDGYIPFVAEVTISAGTTTTSRIDMVPIHHYRATHGDRIWTWVSWGLGVAALGASIGVGVWAADQQSHALNPYDAGALENARGIAGWSDAALGAAIGFGVLGVVLWFVEGNAVGSELLEGPDSTPVTH